MPRQHPDEIVVERTVEAFWKDVEDHVKAFMVGERPIFTRKLSDEEELQRYFDPEMRAAMEANIQRMEGPQGVAKYHSRMIEMNRKYQESLFKEAS